MDLPSLPSETILHISDYLSYGSQLALKLSCRKLFVKTDHPTERYTMADLLEIDQWPDYNGAKSMPPECMQPDGQRDFFGCHLCLKIRSADNFANAMMKSKRGKLGQGTVEEKSKRFCIRCGIAYGKYQRGTYLQFGGVAGWRGLVCCRCGNFEATQGYSEKQVAERRCCMCWDHSHQRKAQWDPFYISIDCSDWRDLDF